MSFSKRSDNAPVCYTKPLDSLKHWNVHFFLVDASVFPLAISWHNNKPLRKDPHSTPAEFNADVCNYLADNPAPFRKLSEPFLCFVGISRYHDLDENCYPPSGLAMMRVGVLYPTKVRIREREVGEEEVSLLQLTKGCVVLLTGVTDQENANIQVAGENNTNEEGDDAAVADQIQEGDHVIQDEGVDFVRIEDEVPVVKLTEDHGTFGHVGASTGGKSLATIQELFEQSTLNVEVGVTAAATVPFFTSSVTPIPERGDGGPTDSVFVANLRTQRPSERFVISSYSSHDSSANAANDEVTSFIRDSASLSTAEADVVGPSQPASAEASTNTFLVSQDLDYETLQQIYMPKWDMINDSALDDPEVCRGMVDQLAPPRVARQACLSAEVRLRSEHNYTKRKKFERRCVRLNGLLKDRDAEIATVEAAIGELDGLKEHNSTLEGQVAALESTTAIKDAELASSNAQIVKLTQELSNFQLSCDELSIKAASLESEKDNLIGLVSTIEGTCSRLRDEVSGINADLMGMALHLHEEFYPRFLTTITGRRCILSRGLKLVVIKCLQLPEYLAALRGSIGCAIDKGIKDGLAANIDHGKVGRGLAEVVAYNLSAEANYVAAVSALRDMDFPLLA
ncbi:hypothetical protein Tco_0677876 [Tanacetum coccineum]|uniref:Transposase (Putative), gypsy type n=1 Tax=Tanacetum coccineum TaxID=301880 RepID=A0ABQ4XER9_9ASTR